MVNDLSIYFGRGIRGLSEEEREQMKPIYPKLITHLQKYGKVLTEHFSDIDPSDEKMPNKKIHDRDIYWLQEESDAAVFEVTGSTTGGGYEIGRTAERNFWLQFIKNNSDLKIQGNIVPILCLSRISPEKQSAMIDGSDIIDAVKYYNKIEDAVTHIDDFMELEFSVRM